MRAYIASIEPQVHSTQEASYVRRSLLGTIPLRNHNPLHPHWSRPVSRRGKRRWFLSTNPATICAKKGQMDGSARSRIRKVSLGRHPSMALAADRIDRRSPPHNAAIETARARVDLAESFHSASTPPAPVRIPRGHQCTHSSTPRLSRTLDIHALSRGEDPDLLA